MKIKRPHKIFSELEFLNIIKESFSHTEAMKKLGYTGHFTCKHSRYGTLLERLKPNIDHFKLFSRSRLKSNKDKSFIVDALYNIYIKGAIKRNINFELTIEEFNMLIYNKCFYCNKLGNSKYSQSQFYCGIDRKDNSKGYISENCVSCCKICNSMKSKLLASEFLEHINKIYEYQKTKD